MNRREALHRLHFDDEGAFHEKIGSEPLSQKHAVIYDVDKLLPLHSQTEPNQARLQYRLIDGFEKAGPEIPMDTEAAVDRQPRTFFNFSHRPSTQIAPTPRRDERRRSRTPSRSSRIFA